MLIAQALQDATAALRAIDAETAARDARLLMQHVLQCDLSTLLLYRNRTLTPDEQAHWNGLIAQRLTHRPIAKIIGQKEFYGASFKTTAATLDPRPDSETLIEHVQTLYPDRDAPLRILDLGTGTGCLLLTLLRLYPQASGIGADVSLDALQVAQDNAYHHKLLERSELLQSDWFSNITGLFDLIISNPPYIDHAALAQLDPAVRLFDPMLALDGGPDGLAPYRILTTHAPRHLKPGGWLVVEIGYDQGDTVPALFTAVNLQNLTLHRDLAQQPRVVSGQYNGA